MHDQERRWQDDIIAFWFGLGEERWFTESAEFDAECRERFLALWEEQQAQPPDAFLGSADDALAAILLFDQMPRNMFRGHADSFATDTLALAIAKGAVERGYDDGASRERRLFFYLPFEHSEALDDQQRSLALFTALGDAQLLDYAKKHHDIIARFGRFPHRNAMLGRQPRADEISAGDVNPF